VTITLTAFKVAVGVLSNSVGVLSEAIHSGLDLVSAAVAFFTIREAGKPADHDHPYGHGRIETLSSLLESILLIVAAGFIQLEAIDHFRNPHEIQHEYLAMLTIFVSMVVSYWAFRHNHHVAKETESSALHVNALHFLSGVVASAGVLVGLILMKWTGWVLIDPIIATCVAAYIFAISINQVKRSLLELADTGLPEHELRDIRNVLERHQESAIEMHELRTRKSGAERHVDFHMVVCGHTSVQESHSLCDKLEGEIQEIFPRASVNIHVEPCEHEGVNCIENCPFRDAQGKLPSERKLNAPLPSRP